MFRPVYGKPLPLSGGVLFVVVARVARPAVALALVLRFAARSWLTMWRMEEDD